MARGKKAAQSATRRAVDAQDEVTRLRALLAEERAGRSHEVAGLRTEVQRLQGAITSDVDRRARDEIEKVRAHAEEQIAVERERAESRARDVVTLIEKHGAWDCDPEMLDELAELCGRSYVELLGMDKDSRRVRRGASSNDQAWAAQQLKARGGRKQSVRCLRCLGAGRVDAEIAKTWEAAGI